MGQLLIGPVAATRACNRFSYSGSSTLFPGGHRSATRTGGRINAIQRGTLNACISSRIATVIHVNNLNGPAHCNWLTEPFAVSRSTAFVLRLAWLNL